ncbi:6-bladed beta-propeller [Candidatus Palauibacter sp.]|uniref:6-bladed beta-propeller n=1 Tax=Candidatus Palauibacter sp. TaxID=3101350 RepID=UPI003B02054E
MADAVPVLDLGNLDGDGPAVFGSIIDVELDERGHIYVLDEISRNLRIFDAAGEPVARMGRQGAGPMEFRSPNAFALLTDGRIVVHDRGNRHLKVFGSTASGYALLETVPLHFVSEDLCVTHDRLFAEGWARDGDYILHEVAVGDSGEDRDFGSGYEADSGLIRGQLSDGRIACLRDPPRVVFGLQLLPVVRAYSALGDLLWVAKVSDYAQLQILSGIDPDGPYVYFPGEGASEELVFAGAISPTHLLLQFAREGSRPVGDPDLTFRTYLVDAATGHGSLINDELPRIVTVTQTHYIVAWATPFPRLQVRRFAESAAALGAVDSDEPSP